MSLLGDLLAQTQIWATLALLVGIAILTSMIVWRSRVQKIAWIINVELATYNIVIGALLWLRLYGVDVAIALGLTGWLFLSAVSATIVVFLVNKSRTA